MKKRIICFILAAIMIVGIAPLSIFASSDTSGTLSASTDTETDSSDALPEVSVASLYSIRGSLDAHDYRALPDDSGVFYFDIALDKAPAVDGEILVYYRTVDDSAVAKWGDYESVGTNGDAYVTLNKANGYKARVMVKSTILDDAFRGPTAGYTTEELEDMIFSRRFYFELIDVEGNAVISKPSDDTEKDESYLTCYLRAERYVYQQSIGVPYGSTRKTYSNEINTPAYDGTYTRPLNISFDDNWRNTISTGNYSIGMAMFGDCRVNDWNCDAPVTFHLYYTHDGRKKKAFSLYMEGEWDDSTFFGWELAYDYIDNNFYEDEKGLVDVEDFMDDNFIGITLYDNNENVVFSTMMDSDRGTLDINDVCTDLKRARREGYAVEKSSGMSSSVYQVSYLHYMQLPSNFVHADSYSYEVISSSYWNGEDGDPRRLDGVSLSFYIMGDKNPKIVETSDGVQRVSTNIGELMEDDQIKMSVRFDRPVYFTGNNCYITADINGQHEITLNAERTLACDTLVFTGDLPDDVKDIKISSLRNIKMVNAGINSFLTNISPLSTIIKDIYSYKSDLRTPVASVSIGETESWMTSRAMDVYLSVKDMSARFSDYATIYYQWSNSKELPEKYSYKLTFHTDNDGEVIKSIVGTGNGETYLHIKAVSRYGKSSVSDKLTGTYDPNDPTAVYTPFGPYKFDNEPPSLSVDDIEISGTLKERTISLELPDDNGGSGVETMSLYYIPPDAESREGVLLKNFKADDFSGDPKTLRYTISHTQVGVGVDENGKVILERKEVEFYWILSDKRGNISEATAAFTITFDTNDYLSDEILLAEPYDPSDDIDDARFEAASERIDAQTYIYDYSLNNGKNTPIHSETEKDIYFGFSFKIDHEKFGATDNGEYDAIVFYKGEALTNYTVEYIDGVYAVWLHDKIESGKYDIRLTRTEGDSVRVSMTYSIYATDDENDETEVKNKIDSGTLLNNNIYQLSSQYPYFYYKDSEGVRREEYYNGTKQPASFSSYEKAKEYVYFKELSDIYLIQLNGALATALNSGTTGYLIAKGETTIPQAGQYWIRYKSESWTPTSGDTSWVYYYYGASAELAEDSLSLNLQNALNSVSKRIVGYGKSIILTDTSLFLGSTMGEKLLDERGMPYLQEGQVHNTVETANVTKCANAWKAPVTYAADVNIYKSLIHVGSEGGADYKEYPIIGSFSVPESSLFQYMTYEEYVKSSTWRMLPLKEGETFFDFFVASGIYYIREMSNNGVSVYAVYVDKEAPKVSFSKKNDDGSLEQIPVDGVEIVDIRAKEVIIGNISATEYDRLSYVAVYKVSNLSLVAIYTAQDLDSETVALKDGNYYIVVSDRSGNHYTVTARVSSSDLDCQIRETENKFIKLICNRSSNQILRYEVYLSGELVTSTYATEQSFDRAGLYTIYVQDIYGNVFSEEYLFEREYPEVTWKYFGLDGKYHTYDSNTPTANGFVMSQVYDNNYKLSTSVKTRFSFSENYAYEFVGVAPEYSETIGAETTVTIEAGHSFTLKVYYKNHPDNYTLYSGVVDVTPPTINVSAEVAIPINGEQELIEQWIANGNDGDIISQDELYYLVREKSRRTVMNGGLVSSDIITINATDANGMSLVEVYVDGVLLKSQSLKTGFSSIAVSRLGSYRIVAKDSLGNVAEFTFTNGIPDLLKYYVDNVEKEVDTHAYLNFETVDGKKRYTKVDYGNTSFRLDLVSNADVFISLSTLNGDSEICGFRIVDGSICPLFYKIARDKNDNKIVVRSIGDAILDVKAEGFETNKEYLINEDGICSIYVVVTGKNEVSIRVYASEATDEVLRVSARVEFGSDDTRFVSAEISKKCPEISFMGPDGSELAGAASNTEIHANSGFYVDESMLESELVASVKLYYSKLNDLNADSLENRTDIYAPGKFYSDDGFYILIAKNYFGNETVYLIGVSKSFRTTSSVTFSDGYKIYYSKDYDEKLYSDYCITIDILDETVIYEVTSRGVAYVGYTIKRENGTTYLVFTEEGSYKIKLSDSYGNELTKELEINKSVYSIGDDLLTGYNEKALKRNEGYTNQKLSINKEAYERDGIYYLAIRYGETLRVLFDAFSEDPIEIDSQMLSEVVGATGDGVYTVICRNRYGTVVTKEIHYRGTPTLKLERTTRSHSEAEIYDLSLALSLGFWSNNTLIFNTEAKTYVFTINSDVTECPRTLSFGSTGDFGSTEYDITYIDEYGFEYKFKAYLVRKTVNVSVSESVTGVELNGVLNTKDNISVIFDNDAYATYVRDNGEPVSYSSGDVQTKDGTYRFTVTDLAGNTSMLTIRKDTIVDFAVVEVNSNTVIPNGGVVNSSKVSVNILNGDKVHIEKALLDGVIQNEYSGFKFSEDGKWELILRDELGNRAYCCFYIVTHLRNGFDYTTPYEYRITELWYNSGDDTKISYMNLVNHGDDRSSFSFSENGKYTVVMMSELNGSTLSFDFTVNTTPPQVSLVGCNVGETTIDDVTLSGCKVGDRVMVYKLTKTGEKLVHDVEITSLSTQLPTISEGGEYRIVIESEAGVATELSFTRKHVMNTAGSVFVLITIGISVVGLFAGLIYRNKSKTDD